jgi:DNA-binding winged helix-turn-helix (wHTH) protein
MAPPDVPGQIRFGDYVLDLGTRELWRGAETVHLTKKAFELLTFLVEERPRVVGKVALQERLWPKTFVSEANLAILVAEIRAALGDTARKPTFIRTVHGVGYAFCREASGDGAPVAPVATSSCWLVSKSRQFPLHEGENVIGRDPAGEVWLDIRGVSRRHARLVVHGSEATLEDLGSKNGTWVDNQRLLSLHALADGDEIRLGTVKMAFRVWSDGGSTDTAGSI